jgi:mannan endo-1,4-beta-mannosidase
VTPHPHRTLPLLTVLGLVGALLTVGAASSPVATAAPRLQPVTASSATAPRSVDRAHLLRFSAARRAMATAMPATTLPATTLPSTTLPSTTLPSTAAPTGSDFVTRTGSTLLLGGQPYRFTGSDMYWLALDDNVRDTTGQPTYPTPFRIDDAMTTAQAQGGTVVRAWANTVGCARCIEPQLGVFNDSAFTSLDYAVASAARHGQRMVLSLVDNWDYYHGSKLTYTRWRGKPESAFFSDPQVIADYQAFIGHVVSHVNPWTGLAYRDDPTIMAWETGNEMWCQTCAGNFWDGSWTRAVADRIKAVAPRQLVVDGHGTDPSCVTACLHVPSLDIGSVDLVDDHFYPMTPARVRTSSALAAAHGKGYLVGEYDWAGARGGSSLADFLQTVETNPVSGDLLWAVIPHADSQGFVDHDDGFQMFFPGRSPDQVARTRQLIAHAALMSGRATATLLSFVPAPPTGVTARLSGGTASLTWQGAAGAASYDVARTDASSGWRTWTIVSSGVDDHRVAYGPLWTDPYPPSQPGAQPVYQVRSRSLTGATSGWSLTVLGTPPGQG